jgi:hypothetical protein
MATTGRWSNVGDWLYYCMLHERNMRVLVHLENHAYRRAFSTEIARVFKRFAALPLASRGGIGLVAVDVQNTLKTMLIENECLIVAPSSPAICAASVTEAKRSLPRPLVIGISMTNPKPVDLSAFHLVCDYHPNAPVCVLPHRLAPAPEPAPQVNEISDDDIQELLALQDEEENAREALSLPDVVEDDDAGTSAFFTKCPICLEIPFPPWKTTTCGHLICAECHAKLPDRSKCPTCRQTCATTLVPQLLFAEVAKANDVKIRCRYEDCRRKVPWDAARAHHDACVHRHQECPRMALLFLKNPNTCAWKGPLSLVGKHLMTEHGAMECTQPSLALADDIRNLTIVVWTREQTVASMYQQEGSNALVVHMATLVPRHMYFKMEVDMGDSYRGSCVMKATMLKSDITKDFVAFPRPNKKTPFTVLVQRAEDLDAKKRMRDEDEKNELPDAKEARVYVDEKADKREEDAVDIDI